MACSVTIGKCEQHRYYCPNYKGGHVCFRYYVSETMCKEPMPVLGARVSYPSLSVHASATYRCSEGYQAAGGDFSHTCQVDGTWSGQRPTCEGQ